MIRLAILTVCVAVAVAQDEWTRPAFCKRNDCPVFETVSEEDGYEVRRYAPSKWVSTSYTVNPGEEARAKGRAAFWRLYKYITGNNENDEKIPMTAPVVTKMAYSDSPSGPVTYTRYFYISSARQTDAPEPSGDDVVLEEMPEFTVYVKSFSGRASQQDSLDQLEALKESVGDGNFQDGHFFRAGYDSPRTVFNRHNEVWLSVKP